MKRPNWWFQLPPNERDRYDLQIELGRIFGEKREKLGLSQLETARLIGFKSKTPIDRLESGHLHVETSAKHLWALKQKIKAFDIGIRRWRDVKAVIGETAFLHLTEGDQS